MKLSTFPRRLAGGQVVPAVRGVAPRAAILMNCVILVSATMTANAAELCGETVASAEALEAVVKAKPGVRVLPSASTYVSYHDPVTKYIWNFATTINPAFPSVACRRIVETAGEHRVATNIWCEADKEACDREAAAYQRLDRQMTEAISKSAPR